MLRIRRTRTESLWPTLLLLLVAALVPATCVLWFMTEAMSNERLAIRQELTAAYRSQMAAIERRFDTFWKEKQDALAAVDPRAAASEIFADLVRNNVADSVIVYDASGRVRYPAFSKVLADENTAELPQWLGARDLEFVSADYAAAANAYAGIVREATDTNAAARALQAQARCLVKAGQNQAALDILTKALTDPQYHNTTDTHGCLIVPNSQLLALRLMADPSRTGYQGTLAFLVQQLTDYSDPSLPSSQRLFLMQQLRSTVPGCPEFPTLAAEALAAEYIESDRPPSQGTYLHPTELGNVWQLASPDKAVVAIFQEDRIIADVRPLIDAELSVPDVTVTLLPPGMQPPQPDPFLTTRAGDFLPSWRLALDLGGSDLFSVAADRQATVYLWTGVIVVILTVILAGLAARYVSAQVRLARLKNNLVATVSHELKTPLSSMRALVDTLLSGRYRDNEQLQEYLQLITKENQRLSHLIDNFLTFSRMERNKQSFEFTDVKIDTIVSSALDAVRERFESPRCRLDVDIAPGLPTIHGDSDALTTVLINLLDNAYKYSGDEKHIILRAYADNGNICLGLKDNGVGLSRRDAKKIFGRFYQLDQSMSRSGGGCGLGLSIVQFIVSAHGGSVSVASQPGKGSTFTVRLPAGGATTDTTT